MRLSGLLKRDRVAAAAALLAPLVVCAVLSLFRDWLPNTDAALVLVLVVVAVAANGDQAGRQPGSRLHRRVVRLLLDQAIPAIHHRPQ